MNRKTSDNTLKSVRIRSQDSQLILEGLLSIQTVPELQKNLKQTRLETVKTVDLSGIDYIDSAGVAFLEELIDRTGSTLNLQKANEKVQRALETFSSHENQKPEQLPEPGFFESVGNSVYNIGDSAMDFLFLTSEIVLWSFYGIFHPGSRRKGSVIQQSYLIGSNAIGIIALLSFVLGLILALQSAAQLRQFGASIYVADLIAISMVREMGPMMTAIIIAGRSGSAFAAEISTMKVTEELDALKMMAINPVSYVVVPKFLAITICMPLLVTLSMILGILGGFVIGLTYLDLTFVSYFNETVSILTAEDMLVGLSKSIFFAWVIVIIGSYFGFKAQGGAEGVGKVTTSAVVASIFAVIFLDALFSLIYMI